jgi:hypothetical protein
VGDRSRLIVVFVVVPLTGGLPIRKQRWVASQVPTGYRRHLSNPNMRNRLLLLVSGPAKCTGLEPLGAESLLLDRLSGDLALGSNHWCRASELAAREYSRQTDKVSAFHSLESLEVMRYSFS